MTSFSQICGPKENCDAEALEHIIQIAVEIAREGHKIGTLFVVADEIETLKRSRNLILDPLYGHSKVFQWIPSSC